MDNEEKWLKEWEKHYDSYINYHNSYLRVFTISIIIVSGAYTIAFGADITYVPKMILLGMPIATMITLYLISSVGYDVIYKLGKRMRILQINLKMDKFNTTEALERSIPMGKNLSLIFLLIFIFIFIIVALNLL